MVITAGPGITGELNLGDIFERAHGFTRSDLGMDLDIHVNKARKQFEGDKALLSRGAVAVRMNECKDAIPFAGEWNPVKMSLAKEAIKDIQPSIGLVTLKKVAKKGTIAELSGDEATLCRIADVLGLVTPEAISEEGEGIQVYLYHGPEGSSKVALFLPADGQGARMIVGSATGYIELERDRTLKYLVDEAGYRAAYKEPSETASV